MESVGRKHVVVTGHVGYIGRNLLPMFFRENTAWISKLTCFDSKVGAAIGFPALYQMDGADIIIHLAAHSHIAEEHDYNKTIRDNLTALDILLCAAKKSCPKGVKFIFFSTSGVHQREGIGAYVLSKMLGEQMVKDSGIKDWHIIRPCNIVGAADFDGFDTPANGHIFPMLELASRNKDPFIIHGKGTQRRSYVHVRDLCQLVIDICTGKSFPEQKEERIHEVNCGELASVLEIVEFWKSMVDCNLKFSFAGERRSDPRKIPLAQEGRPIGTTLYPNGVYKALADYVRRFACKGI